MMRSEDGGKWSRHTVCEVAEGVVVPPPEDLKRSADDTQETQETRETREKREMQEMQETRETREMQEMQETQEDSEHVEDAFGPTETNDTGEAREESPLEPEEREPEKARRAGYQNGVRRGSAGSVPRDYSIQSTSVRDRVARHEQRDPPMHMSQGGAIMAEMREALTCAICLQTLRDPEDGDAVTLSVTSACEVGPRCRIQSRSLVPCLQKSKRTWQRPGDARCS